MRTQAQAVQILGEVYTLCNPVLGNRVTDAFLYGSYARGDYHEWSDIDILLTVDISPENISRTRKNISGIISDISLKYDVTVSVTVKSAEHFHKYAGVLPYFKNVVSEGIRYAV